MDKNLSRAALLVAVIVSVLMGMSIWDPGYPVIGTAYAPSVYAKSLWGVFIIMMLLSCSRRIRGAFQRVSENLVRNVSLYVVLTLLVIAYFFFIGYHANSLGIGLGRSVYVVALGCLLVGASTVTLVFVCMNGKVTKVFDLSWLKWSCVCVCLILNFYVLYRSGFQAYWIVKGHNVGWMSTLWFLPALWYLVAILYRLIRGVVKSGWKSLVFKKYES